MKVIASYPKSGSTWIRMLISAYMTDDAVDINRPIGVQGDNHIKFFQSACCVPMTDLSPQEKLLFRPAGLFNINRTAVPGIVKTHCCNAVINGIDLWPPGLVEKALYVVRDPRAVVPSLAAHMGLSIDQAIETMADENFTLVGEHSMPSPLTEWWRHVNSWAAAEFEVAVIRYEDLHQFPVNVASNMLEFLGFNVELNRVKRAVERCKFSKLRAQEEKSGFDERSSKADAFFRRGEAYKWHEELTPAQIARIEETQREGMLQCGYLGKDAANG